MQKEIQWKSDQPDYIENIEGGERRFYPTEIRQEEDGTIEGIASVVEKDYDLGWFTERVAKGAFDDVLKDDVRALFNHEPSLILARTKPKTLKLSLNENGDLVYRYKTPERSYAKDLENAIRSGDVDQSSFAFRVKEDKWEYKSDDDSLKKDRRTILKLARLYDVSPVTYPASPSTKVAARAITIHEEELKKNKNQINKIKAIELQLKVMGLNI